MTNSSLSIKERLKRHIQHLAKTRCHLFYEKNVQEILAYLESEMQTFGYKTYRHAFGMIDKNAINVECIPQSNEVTDIFLACTAHHDSFINTPGADDNASALAVLLEVARNLVNNNHADGIAFIFFDAEELSFEMLRFLALLFLYNYDIEHEKDPKRKKFLEKCRDEYIDKNKDLQGKLSLDGSKYWIEERFSAYRNLKAVINLESVGFTDVKERSQQQIPNYRKIPSVGDFLAIVYLSKYEWLVRELTSYFLQYLKLLPFEANPKDTKFARRSDHARFWDIGLPAVMLTDTFEYRNPHYHKPTDTPETLDYSFMAAQTKWLIKALPQLAQKLSSQNNLIHLNKQC